MLDSKVQIEQIKTVNLISDMGANLGRVFDRCPEEIGQLLQFVMDRDDLPDFKEDDPEQALKQIGPILGAMMLSDSCRNALSRISDNYAQLPSGTTGGTPMYFTWGLVAITFAVMTIIGLKCAKDEMDKQTGGGSDDDNDNDSADGGDEPDQ